MMNTIQENMSSLLIGFYAWVSAVFLGGILLDIAYANLLRDTLGTTRSDLLFSEGSDFLLLMGVVTILAAVVAIVSAWSSSAVRGLLVASLFIVILEFLGPVFYSPIIRAAQALNIGPWLRILPSALASVLEFFGLFKYYRRYSI